MRVSVDDSAASRMIKRLAEGSEPDFKAADGKK